LYIFSRLSTKIALIISLILVMLLLFSASAFIYYETYEFEEAIEKRAHQVLTVLESVHTQAMITRGNIGANNPAIQTLNQTFDQLSKTTIDMSLWLVMGPKVLAFQEKIKSSYGIEPPKDEIDHEAIRTGLPVTRMVGSDFFRYTKPVILGKGSAAHESCLSCHRDMGMKEGDILGAFSISLNVKERREEYITTAWAAAMIAVFVSVVVSAFSIFLLNRMAISPVARMTETMTRLARGDLQVKIPEGGRGDEIGEMAQAVEVFRENAVERKQAEVELREAHDELEQRVEERTRELREEITDRKQAEDEAKQHRNVLAHFGGVSIMGEMASSLAHELNQPLTVISSYAQVCIDYLRKSKDKPNVMLADLEHMKGQAERATGIIRRIRNQIHKGEPVRKEINVNDTINDVADLIRSDAREHGTNIDLDLGENLPLVIADPIQIQQVILNLAHNGMEAMSENPASSASLAIITSTSEDDAVEIAIRDDGQGISAETLDKVFDSFFTTKKTGLGMGLSICRSIIEAHGGKLWAESDSASGSVFHFTLPVEKERMTDG